MPWKIQNGRPDAIIDFNALNNVNFFKFKNLSILSVIS